MNIVIEDDDLTEQQQ